METPRFFAFQVFGTILCEFRMMGLPFIMAISFGLFIVHLVALYQMEFTHSRALFYEEVLENRNKLLQLENGITTTVLLVIALAVLFVAAIGGILRTSAMVSTALPCVSLIAALAVHLFDFRASTRGTKWWYWDAPNNFL